MELKININNPPKGYKYTGEYRQPRDDEYYLYKDQVSRAAGDHGPEYEARFILEKLKTYTMDEIVGRKFRIKGGSNKEYVILKSNRLYVHVFSTDNGVNGELTILGIDPSEYDSIIEYFATGLRYFV